MSQNRREFLQAGLVGGAYGLGMAGLVSAEDIDPEVTRELADRLKYLVAPDGSPPDIESRPSPPAKAFTTKFFRPRVPVPILDVSTLEDEVAVTIEERRKAEQPLLRKDELAELSDEERFELSGSPSDQLWAIRFRRKFREKAKSLREHPENYKLDKGLDIGGPPDFLSHQRFFEFKPKAMYVMLERKFPWAYHEGAGGEKGDSVKPWGDGSWTWGYVVLSYSKDEKNADGTYKLDWRPICPGPAFHARYGEPILVRRINDLPEILDDDARWNRSLPTRGKAREASGGVQRRNIKFALPSTTSHLHNAHTASESDGNPNDWINPGEYWDHHYPNFPSGHDDREKLVSLWYHDHRMDFTASNVYAGLTGFYLLFDEPESGQNVGDIVRIVPSAEGLPKVRPPEVPGEERGWTLPSGEYDVPLMLHDLLFGRDEAGRAQLIFDGFNTDGILGDRFTVNRKIQPNFVVKRRKYRFRVYNGGPSRFYELFLHTKESTDVDPFIVITGDGNIQPNPVLTPNIFLGVAQRVDFLLDFSQLPKGTKYVYLVNQAEQINGKGPTGRHHLRPSRAEGPDGDKILDA